MLLKSKIEKLENVDLRKFCSIKIGGIGKQIYIPKSIDELILVYHESLEKGKNFIPIGIGSNVIFKDGILDHFFVLTRKLKGITIKEDKKDVYITAMAGVSFKEITSIVKSKNLEGFEGLSGIPATVGGAVVMNAGAFGQETYDILEKVVWINEHGDLVESYKKDLKFGYRYSQFQESGIVVSATFKLKKSNKPIEKIIKEIALKRNQKQPLELPTSGSTYKNTNKYHAGFLLEKSGLKGYKIGNIGFSPKHANFLINYGNASFSDLIKLLEYAENSVYEAFGINLKREVKIIA